jgi:Nitrate reductase delta subunit
MPITASAWELIRSLGAVVLTPPPGNSALCAALELPIPTGAEHTDAFVLSAPPHAAIHLGPEGKLGGEGLDRIAGFWRVLGLRAPEDADHLGALLMLYAELGDAEDGASDERGRAQLHRARTALFHEHIWSWTPGYLFAVAELGIESVAAWARLTGHALRAEYAALEPPEMLPLALRAAPPGLDAADSLDETLDALVAPIRAGVVLTYRDLAACGRQVGVGLRRGERRFALRAMLEQDAPATLCWLSGHAQRLSDRHASAPRTANDPCAWWSRRAANTAGVLETLAAAGTRRREELRC